MILFITLPVSVPAPALAQEKIVLPGYATFTFESIVRLKAKGCTNIPISFETFDELERENTGMSVLLDNNKRNDGIGYGMVGWFSKLTYKGAPTIDFEWPRVGTLDLKVCRNNWTSGTGTSKTRFLKVKPATYEILFQGFYVDKEIGRPSKQELVTSKVTLR